MRPPRLPSPRLFQMPPFTVILATVGAIVLMFFAVEGHGSAVASSRIAVERAVYRTLIDSFYTVPIDSGARTFRDVILYDHFVQPDVVVGDTLVSSYADEWLRDSVPRLPADARADFRSRSMDTSSIVAAMLQPDAGADTESALPLPGTRAHLLLLGDSTLAQFFSRTHRQTSGWIGFRAAYPKGTGIISISRIGLSRDDRWAIVYAGQQSDWLAGAGVVYVMQRRGLRWRVVNSRVLWVS